MVTLRPLVCPLFVPATRPERFEKAADSGADAVIIDLEDAVPTTEKDRAREVLVKSLVAKLPVPVFLRVNGRASPWHEFDLSAASKIPIAGVMLPKTESAEDLEKVAERIGSAVPIIALIETARGVTQLGQFGTEANLLQLAFGSIDFALDIGAAHEREPLALARANIVLYSRAHELPAPLDGITVATNDMPLLASESAYAASMGFGGKLAIHPAQIGTIHCAFRPSKREVDWAIRVLEAEKSAAGAVVHVDGAMIDAPIFERARRILARIQNSMPP